MNMIYGTLYYEPDTDGDEIVDGEEKQLFESWEADPAGDSEEDGMPNLLDLDSG